MAQDALPSIATTLHAFPLLVPYHVNFPLSMRMMPLVGVGTAAATTLAGVGALGVHATPRWRRERPPGA